ncbi:hypothetical protein [Mediterraneibacter catenae]|nr:hypothetical protein [Mediterraneibacter catenae]
MMADKENMKETAAGQIVEAVQFANFAGVNAADEVFSREDISNL